MRPGTQHDRAAVKAAVRRALTRAGGGDSFCQATRVGAPALSNYASPARDDLHMPIDVVIDLERDIGAPVVTSELARLAGYRLVFAGANEVAGSPDLSDIAAIAREANDVVAGLAAALSDGAVDRKEAAALRGEIDEACAVLHRLSARLEAANK